MPAAAREPDHVGRIIEQWERERPDLDTEPFALIGRLHRVGAELTRRITAVMAEFGLAEGEFDVLATLRRTGAPYELTPSEIGAQSMVSSGAVTKRVDRLAERGLVSRRVSDADARGRVIALTEAGRDVIDRAYTAHLANEADLVALLPDAERARLTHLLERWGRALSTD